ncbi:MAG: hypothetical protein H7066_09685 [Cytophagaceae bacterium]|nr:hypothetical protein [Gemmatimonadaceae bacterium]
MKRLIALLVSAVALSACSSPTEVKPRLVDAEPQVAKAKTALKVASGISGSTSGKLAGN